MSFKLRKINKRGVSGEVATTFIATILILAILLIFIAVSGAVKAYKNVSGQKDNTQIGNKLGETGIDSYMNYFKGIINYRTISLGGIK